MSLAPIFCLGTQHLTEATVLKREVSEEGKGINGRGWASGGAWVQSGSLLQGPPPLGLQYRLGEDSTQPGTQKKQKSWRSVPLK